MINPRSAPIPKLNNATFSVPVAAVVGGGSVVNGMAYHRGSKEDYDAWEERKLCPNVNTKLTCVTNRTS